MSKAWTLSCQLQNRLDGTYTKLLRRAQNISWTQHATLKTIYGNLPRLSQKLTQRRATFAGHCCRAKQEVVSSVLLWKPTGRVHSRRLTFTDTLVRDTGLDFVYLENAMLDRAVWNGICTGLVPAVGR